MLDIIDKRVKLYWSTANSPKHVFVKLMMLAWIACSLRCGRYWYHY